MSTVDTRVALNALTALTQLVAVANDAIRVHETEATKRQQLKVYGETEIAKIKASEKVLREYLDRVFEERRGIHDSLFVRLDAALESGDSAAMQAVVAGIVDVAKVSPLAGISDLAELRKSMADPDVVFEI